MMMSNVLIQTFLIVFLAEMGDKSQFLMIALSWEYRMRDLLLGVTAAALLLCGLAVTAGAVLGDLFPKTVISIVAGAAFLLFSLLSLGDSEDAGQIEKRRSFAALSVFGTYFLAELGDKTQLSVIALSAFSNSNFWQSAIPVFLGSSVALVAADLLGIVVGTLLRRRIPNEFFSIVSAVLFFACGVLRILEGFGALFEGTMCVAILLTLVPSVVVAVWGILRLLKRKHNTYHKKRA